MSTSLINGDCKAEFFSSVISKTPTMSLHAQCLTRYGGSLSSIKSAIQHLHDHESQEGVIIFRCVSPDIADNVFNWVEGRARVLLSYYPEDFELVVCMPGVHHETASLRFAKRIEDALRPYGLDEEIIPTGSTTFRPSNATQKRAGKQGDAGYKSSIRKKASDVPNIIIETALTQSYPSAVRAANYWLKAIGVPIVIIIVVKPASGSEHRPDYSRLILEHWELVQAKDAQDATAEPINTTSITYNVHTDDCTIVPYCNFRVCTFKKLLDRDPVGEEPNDIVIPPEALHTLARAVFRNNQFLILEFFVVVIPSLTQNNVLSIRPQVYSGGLPCS